MSLIKRDKTDVVFSDLVRLRNNYTCEHCFKSLQHDTGALHCSHYMVRRNTSTRWHPLNAFAHCSKCHKYLEEHPNEFREWVETIHGEELTDKVERLARIPFKMKAWDKEELHKHLLKERARLLSERSSERNDFTVPEWYLGIAA